MDGFGFRVRPPGEIRYDNVRSAGWWVGLPHQCDTWDIVGEEYSEEPDHEKAIAVMEAFVAEAQSALTALREGQSFATTSPHDW